MAASDALLPTPSSNARDRRSSPRAAEHGSAAGTPRLSSSVGRVSRPTERRLLLLAVLRVDVDPVEAAGPVGIFPPNRRAAGAALEKPDEPAAAAAQHDHEQRRREEFTCHFLF